MGHSGELRAVQAAWKVQTDSIQSVGNKEDPRIQPVLSIKTVEEAVRFPGMIQLKGGGMREGT